MKTCGNCRHFAPDSIHTAGTCAWPSPVPFNQYPMAYRRAGWGYPVIVWTDTKATTCPCWVKKEGK